MSPIRLSASLRQRLLLVIAKGEAELLWQTLRKLPHRDQRTAHLILSDPTTWQAVGTDQFWLFFCHLVLADAPAFLGTMCKAVTALRPMQKLTFTHPTFVHWAQQQASPIDRQKCLLWCLPTIDDLAEAEQLADHLRLASFSHTQQARLFLTVATPCAYYLLFRVLQQCEGEHSILRAYTLELIKRQDEVAARLASFLVVYFELPNIPVQFAQSLPAYQLASIADNYDYFKKFLGL